MYISCVYINYVLINHNAKYKHWKIAFSFPVWFIMRLDFLFFFGKEIMRLDI